MGRGVAARRGAHPAAQTPGGLGEGLGPGPGSSGQERALQLAAAGPADGGPGRAPRARGPAASGPRGRKALSSAGASCRGAAEGRRKPSERSWRPGRDSRGGGSANLRALTRGAAPLARISAHPGRGAPRGSRCGLCARGSAAAPARGARRLSARPRPLLVRPGSQPQPCRRSRSFSACQAGPPARPAEKRTSAEDRVAPKLGWAAASGPCASHELGRRPGDPRLPPREQRLARLRPLPSGSPIPASPSSLC